MSEHKQSAKLLKQLTQHRKKPSKKTQAASAAAKEREAKRNTAKVEENPLLKSMRSYIPAWMKRPTAKLGFDALMFVGSCVVIMQFGKALHDSLDDIVPSEKKILAEMKAEQEMMM